MANVDRPELALDKASQVGFVGFFAGLDGKPEDLIRLFERNGGEYYSVHGDDALYIAKEFYKTNSVLKYIADADNQLPSCTLSRAGFEAFLLDALQNKRLKLQIWALSEIRKPNSWKIVKEASPGNIRHVEDLVQLDTNDPVIVSVRLVASGKDIRVGVGIADASEKSVGVSEFLDNDLLTNLESILIQICARECVLCDERSSLAQETLRLKTLLQMSGIAVTLVPKRMFDVIDIVDLNRILRNPILSLPDCSVALSALNALLLHLDVLNDDSFTGELTFKEQNLNQFARLDAHALTALSLMGEGPRKSTHLFGLLNRCKTKGGSRLLNSLIRQPLVVLSEIRMRHALVAEMINSPVIFDALRTQLQAVPDVGRLAKKLRRGSASIQDLVILYQFGARLPSLLPPLEVTRVLRERYYSLFVEICESLKPFLELIEDTIDLDSAENHEYIIKASYSEDLELIKSQMDALKNRVQNEVMSVAEKLGVEIHKVLKLENSSNYGYHMRVSISSASLLKGRNFIELSTLKSGVLFTTLKLQITAKEIIELSQDYLIKQDMLVKKMMESVATYIETFTLAALTLSELDVFMAFADVSKNAPIPYVQPQMTEERSLRLIACRHPCVEIQDGMAFIPNDAEMVEGMSEFLVITGPNMGGKSTYIRQIAVIALMAQIGCFVPCDSAIMPVFDAFMCRIGASDDQMRGISTFMAEMLETAAILRTATAASLVVIDELGRGTSTYDGFGLAYAISHHLATNVHCLCLFATHFHEMTALAGVAPAVKNVHVEAFAEESAKDITLLYRVMPGPCDQSFGIHVAKMAGLPQSVIATAALKVQELERPRGALESKNKYTFLSQEAVVEDLQLKQGNEIIDSYLREFSEIDVEAEDWHDKVEHLAVKFSPHVDANAYLKKLMASFNS